MNAVSVSFGRHHFTSAIYDTPALSVVATIDRRRIELGPLSMDIRP